VKTNKNKESQGAQLHLSDKDIEKLGKEIGRAIGEYLQLFLSSNNYSRPTNINSPTSISSHIDERIIDVGVSTEGLVKPNTSDIVSKQITTDDLSSTTNKLKNLKRK